MADYMMIEAAGIEVRVSNPGKPFFQKHVQPSYARKD